MIEREDWLLWRSKGIGSSDIAAIMGENPYRSKLEVFLEKTNQIKPMGLIRGSKDLSKNLAVQRGIALEPIARNKVNEVLNSSFVPINFNHKTIEFMKYSSDGYDAEINKLIEIKCMSKNNHQRVIESNNVLSYYYPQIQWALMVSEAESIYFVSYCQQAQQSLVMIEYFPNLDYFQVMKDFAISFWDDVLEYKKNRGL